MVQIDHSHLTNTGGTGILGYVRAFFVKDAHLDMVF